MKRLLIIAAVLLLPTVIVAGAVGWHLVMQRFDAPGPLAADTDVVIPRGSGLEEIGRMLEEAGVLADDRVFWLVVRVSDRARRLKAGEFRFPAAVSMRGALEILERGDVVVHSLTFPEGIRSTEIAALLNEAEGLTGEISEVPPEGSVLPETYHFVLEDSRSDLLARMTKARDDLLAELWPKRAEDLPIQNPEEAVVLASIVEKETAVGDERPLIAGVFINRLRKGMRLQSDPTVIYGITQGDGDLGRPLTRKDLSNGTPYNTYTIDGLPPGPIANPGRASLEAVLNPAETDYLFFVADGTGGHAFAKTLDEHNRNVAKWRKLQRQNRNTE